MLASEDSLSAPLAAPQVKPCTSCVECLSSLKLLWKHRQAEEAASRGNAATQVIRQGPVRVGPPSGSAQHDPENMTEGVRGGDRRGAQDVTGGA